MRAAHAIRRAAAATPVFSTYLYKTDDAGAPVTTTPIDDTTGVDDPAYGQLVKVFHEDIDDDPLNNESPPYTGLYEEYAYDDEGRQIEVTKPVYLNPVKPEEPVVTKTIYYGDAETGGEEGQVKNVIFNYDPSATPDPSTNVQFEFTYNPDGSRATCIYPSGWVRDFNDEAGPTETPDPYASTYAYNDEGALDSVTRPEGTVDYSYDPAGAMASIRYFGHTVNYQYDFFGRLERAVAPLGEWGYQYNDAGLKTRVENALTGDIETRDYDALGRLTELVHIDDDGTIAFSQDFDLGIGGNRTGILEKRGDTASPDLVKWDYEYDELGRLTAERRDRDDDGGHEYEVEYEYDANSNRTSEHYPHLGSTRTYEYNQAGGFDTNQLSKIDVVAGTTVTREEFTWTDDGEMESHVWNDASGVKDRKQTYQWGPVDTLIRADFHVWDPAGAGQWDHQGWIEFEYDDAQTLVRRTQYDDAGAVVGDTRYLIDTQNLTGYSQVLAEIDGQTGKLSRLNTYTDEIKAQTAYATTTPGGSIQSSPRRRSWMTPI